LAFYLYLSENYNNYILLHNNGGLEMEITVHGRTHSVYLPVVLVFILLFALLPMLLTAQNDVSSDEIIVSVSNVVINGELTIRDQVANFPHPVLTTLSVVDSGGNLISGLADSLRWLGPVDIAEIGVPISEIWNPVLEYHHENHSIPADPDVYNQFYQPTFTEIRSSQPVPTSTMLVMDLTWSMQGELKSAKEGAIAYCNLLRSVDNCGLVQFSDSIITYVKMTKDTSLLKQTIQNAKIHGKTAVYDAIMLAIDGTKIESGRRAVIIYTDGEDNESDPANTPQAVIDSARANRLPIFTIALGQKTHENILKDIADSTGGLFFKAATAQEMRIIYTKLSKVIQNYYVMAHNSPDPRHNGTWRTVDITANVAELSGRGVGRYWIDDTPALNAVDLALATDSHTDTTVIVNNDQMNAVYPGDQFEYSIIVSNSAGNTADSVRVVCQLPDSVKYISATTSPFATVQNTITWSLAQLAPGEERTIDLSVLLADSVAIDYKTLLFTTQLFASNDTSLTNNIVIDSIRVLAPKKPEFQTYDLALSQVALTDTIIISNGDSVKAVSWGKSYRYFLKVKNNSSVTVPNFSLWNVLPESVTVSNFNILPENQSSDTLFWQFQSFEAGDSLLILYDAAAVGLLPAYPYPLITQSGLISEHDSVAENDTASTTVFALDKTPVFTDLDLQFTSVTDTFVRVNQKYYNAIRPGDRYKYLITVTNLGINRADSIRLGQLLPDSVNYVMADGGPVLINPNSLIWTYDSLSAKTVSNILVTVQLSDSVSEALKWLYSGVQILAANDLNITNNQAQDTVLVLPKLKPPADKKFNLAIKQTVFTDTTVEISGETFSAVLEGHSYQYQLRITNDGPATAKNFIFWNAIPDSVKVSDYSLEPQDITNKRVFWKVDSLGVNDSLSVTFQATVSDTVEYFPFPLVSGGGLIVENDLLVDDNFDSTTIYAIVAPYVPDPEISDLSVSQTAFTDSFTLVGNDTLKFVQPSEIYSYRITLTNESDDVAQNVQVTDVLPDSIQVQNIQPTPAIITQDSLRWNIGTLAPNAEFVLTFQAIVASNLPIGNNRFINTVFASSANEDTLFLANNVAIDTVYSFIQPPEPEISDISVTQTALIDSFYIEGNDTLKMIRAGETYSYRISVSNISNVTAQNVQVLDLLPDSIIVSNYSLIPTVLSGDSLRWDVGSLDPAASVELEFEVAVASKMPTGQYNLLINSVIASATNEDTLLLANNVSIDTAYNFEEAPVNWQPSIEVTPTQIKAGDTLSVRVHVTHPVELWDLWIHFADEKIDSTYGDAFISTIRLEPNQWLAVSPLFTNTKMRTQAKEEQVTFEFRAIDKFGISKFARDSVRIQAVVEDDDGKDRFDFNRNVFRPGKEDALEIKFKLESSDNVQIDIFDITGTRISKITEAQYQAGWNTFSWNGLTENGQEIGRGFYIITFRSSESHAWKKLMILR